MSRRLALLLAILLTTGASRVSPLRADPPSPSDVGDVSVYDRPLPVDGVASTVVVDDETGKPIEGALVRAFTEDIDTRTLEFGRVPVGERRTDAQGVASLPLLQGEADHWLVTAPGYAMLHQFGYWPPKVSRLERGRELRFRVVDVWGAPIANAKVEAYAGDGCPHSPAFWRGTTAADGVAAIPESPFEVNLWIDAAGFVVGNHSVSGRLGTTPDTVVLEPAVTVRGTIRGPDGQPLEGAVVRGTDYPRGPAATTNADGGFSLAGVGRDEAILVAHPDGRGSEEDKAHTVRRTVADHPLELTWTAEGFAEAKETGTIELRVQRPAGSQEDSLDLEVVEPDGRPSRMKARWDDEEKAFVDSTEVGAGEVWIRSASPTDPIAIPDTRITVKAGTTKPVEIEGRARVPLRLAGTFDGLDRKKASAALQVGNHFLWLTVSDDLAPDGALAHLDPDVPARLLLYGGDLGNAIADIGPARGVRTAAVLWKKTPRTTIRVVSKKPIDDLYLYVDADLEQAVAADFDSGAQGAVMATEATGPLFLVVRLEDEEHDHVLPIDVPVPKDEKAELVVDLDAATTKQVPVGPIALDVARADGKPLPPLEIRADHLIGRSARGDTLFDATSPATIGGPSLVTVSAKGLQPIRARLREPGGHRVTWPAGSIRATITDSRGKPAPSLALLDGVPHEIGADGRLEVAGLAAGPHALVVSPAKGPGLLWRFTLAGESQERTLALAEAPLDEVESYEGDALPGAADPSAASTVVVDAVTLAPIAGARVRWYPELAADTDIEHSWIMAEGKTDANGVAVVPLHKDWTGDKHWVTLAKGYAPTYEYGKRLSDRSEMRRGRPFSARLRDPFGKPIAGVPVELQLGCGHGPGIAWSRTSRTGIVSFTDLPFQAPNWTFPRIWFVAAGSRATWARTEEGAQGARPRDIVVPPGATARGTVVDVAGAPLAGVVVRQFVETRGPTTKTDADGHFVLHGADPSDEIVFYHPAEWGRLSVPFVPDLELFVTLSVMKPERRAEDATLIVRVAGPDGKAVADGPLVRVVGDDGFVDEGCASERTEELDDFRLAVGDAKLELPAGPYEVRSAGPFGRYEIRRKGVTADKGIRTWVDVVADPRPRVVVTGARAGERVTVWCEGESEIASDDTRVPTDAPAAVEAGGRWVVVGPVGADGARHADLSTVKRHRVRWPAGLEVTDVDLLFLGDVVESQHEVDSISTASAGELVLRLTLKTPRRVIDVPVTLPAEDGAAVDVTVDPVRDGRPAWGGGVLFTPSLPTRSNHANVEIVASDDVTWFEKKTDADEPWPLVLPFSKAMIRVTTDGYAPLLVHASAPGPLEAKWPATSLSLTVIGDGKPVASRVLLDGEWYLNDGKGPLEIRGLAAGEHRALVMDDDRRLGRWWRFAIRDGQRLEKRIRLAPE